MSIRFGRSGGNYSSSEVMQTENDDWRKIEDVAERRRIQNRLAQRNYRRKLRAKLEELEKKAQQSETGSGPAATSSRAARAQTSEGSSSSSPPAPSPVPYGQQITLAEAVPHSSGPFNFDISLDKFLEGVDDILGPYPASTPDSGESPRVNEAGDNTRFTPETCGSDFTPHTSSTSNTFTPAPFGMPMGGSYRPPGYLIPPSFSPPPEDRPMPRQTSSGSNSNDLSFMGFIQGSPSPNVMTPSDSNSSPDSAFERIDKQLRHGATLTGRNIVSRDDFIAAISDVTLPPNFIEIVSPEPTQMQKTFIQHLMSTARPEPSIPSDHKFITLQFNSIFNASILNGIILSFDSLSLVDEDAISPFNTRVAISNNIPKDLEPTAMQISVPHHPYIDIIPFPGFRDKVLRFLDILDEDDVCSCMYTDWGVWGSRPWDKTSWEVGEKFAEKYWFLMDEDMKKTSDFWRGQRGLKPLKIQQKRGVERGKVVGEV